MFNLFKKKENVVIPNRVDNYENTRGYPEEVLEIHHEFETAADRLVEETNSIIAEAEKMDIVKVSRLEKFGFKQAAQVVEAKPMIQKSEISKEQLELLRYYQLEYPNNKFITEEQVKTICHKYNLVCGEVGRFKGFVPEKNLREIESFKLKDKDKIVIKEATFASNWLTEEEMKEAFPNAIFNDIHRQFRTREVKMQICAPIKDMDISGLELVERYKLQKKHIPDPVVLQPVKGGYLILTAWGDEASDELVVNQKMN